MVSVETKGTVCLSQRACVSPGDSRVTCMAGRSRLPHMAAVGGSWPRSWARRCPWSGEQGKHAAAFFLHVAPPHTPDGRPGLSPVLAPAGEAQPRSMLSAWSSKEGMTCCRPSIGTSLLIYQDDRHLCLACDSDGQAHPSRALSQQVGAQPLNAVWTPVALQVFFEGKLRHGLKPAALNPSRVPLIAGLYCFSFPEEVPSLLQTVAVCCERTAGFPPCCCRQGWELFSLSSPASALDPKPQLAQ